MKQWRLYRQRRTRDYQTPAHIRWLRALAAGLLAAILLFSSFRVGSYVGDYLHSRSQSDQLRASYYATVTDLPSAAPVSTARAAATAAPSLPPQAAPSQLLPTVKYPDNPYAVASQRFQKLRRQNPDIVGWLNIPNVLDEAVVQRDNTYYLRRDYKGYHNVNGAIFLEEDCQLRTRPYTLALYGHNMKTGAMFGVLRNYENQTFYHHNPLITFDSLYEDGRYVIFSVCTISTGQFNKDFLDFGKLNASTVAWREEAIDQLRQQSLFTSTVDVAADDQLLLLITCVEDDEERRIVAARRLRADESEEDALAAVLRSRRKTY